MKIQKSKFKIQNFGFTLMEMLVVIAIIVVLISIGVTSFTTAQKKGRDAKRRSDMKELQGALEQYYSVCGYVYPTNTGSGLFTGGIICTSPSIAVMSTVVTDPKGTTPYNCAPTPCDGSTYSICAYLESESVGTFCLKNQQ